jgi:hypothetical protein
MDNEIMREKRRHLSEVFGLDKNTEGTLCSPVQRHVLGCIKTTPSVGLEYCF